MVVFGLALLAALGFGIGHIHALKSSGDSAVFSAPCEPAPPGLYAAGESRAASTPDSGPGAENTTTTAHTAPAFGAEAEAQPQRRAAPRSYPPLLHRPPPANS